MCGKFLFGYIWQTGGVTIKILCFKCILVFWCVWSLHVCLSRDSHMTVLWLNNQTTKFHRNIHLQEKKCQVSARRHFSAAFSSCFVWYLVLVGLGMRRASWHGEVTSIGVPTFEFTRCLRCYEGSSIFICQLQSIWSAPSDFRDACTATLSLSMVTRVALHSTQDLADRAEHAGK